MRELFRLMIVLALAMMLAACTSSTKTIVDNEEVYDDIVTDTTVFDEDATGDKDDLFAEGTLSDDAPVTGDEDNILTDTTPTDTDVVQTDDIVTDDVVTDGDIPDDGMNDDLLSDEDSIIPEGEGGMTDTDVIVAACAQDFVSVTVSIYHLDVNNEKVFDLAGSYTTTPAGQPTEGADPQNICYPINSTVQIHLTANSGYTFNQWMKPNGSPATDVTGTFPDFSVAITNKPKRLSAEFTAN